jgi:hypothetical protein
MHVVSFQTLKRYRLDGKRLQRNPQDCSERPLEGRDAPLELCPGQDVTGSARCTAAKAAVTGGQIANRASPSQPTGRRRRLQRR